MTQHRFLTGVDLHEPLGVEDATSGQVYVADGAGSGAWTAMNNPIPSAIFEHTEAAGDDGGTFTEDDWRTTTINTTALNTISGASLAANQITLPAGTYYLDWWMIARGVDFASSRIYNITDAATLKQGMSSGDQLLVGSVYFTLASTKVFELQAFCVTTNFGDGFGIAFDGSDTELYSQIKIWRDTTS